MELRARLREGAPLLLDGALGTELERRGVRADLPLWSARALLEAPEVVRAIHADYLDAGCAMLTANSFRTQGRVLERAGLGERAGELTSLAVSLARAAAGDTAREVLVLGSAPTLEDCYRPDRVPAQRELTREHAEHVANLLAAGVDGVLVETMNSVREAVAAAAAVSARGAPLLISFVCGSGARLLSGESLADALGAVARFEPDCVAVNCLPPSAVGPCLPVLAAAGRPFGVYANLGAPGPGAGPRAEALTPREFAAEAARWLDAGARLLGGCCGTTPAHLRAVAAGL